MEPGSARFRFSSMCCRCCCCSPTPSTPYMSPTCIHTLPPLYRPSRHGDSSPWPVSHASTKPSGTSATSLLYVLDIPVPRGGRVGEVSGGKIVRSQVVSRRRVVAPTVPRRPTRISRCAHLTTEKCTRLYMLQCTSYAA